jgi:hypothetical protein
LKLFPGETKVGRGGFYKTNGTTRSHAITVVHNVHNDWIWKNGGQSVGAAGGINHDAPHLSSYIH